MSEELKAKVVEFIASKPVAICMKGTPEMPMCGFSARACHLLEVAGVKRDQIAYFNMLENRPLFDALREHTKWPTSPQIFIKGEFVGGSDTLLEMHEAGELEELVKTI